MRTRETALGKDGVLRYRCSICREWMTPNAFSLSRKSHNSRASECRACRHNRHTKKRDKFNHVMRMGGA